MSRDEKTWIRRAGEALCVMLVVVVADQATKLWAVSDLKGQPMTSYLSDVLRIVYAENTGGFLSLGSSFSPLVRFWLLTVINGIVLAVGLGYVMAWRNLGPTVWWGVTLLVSGGLGNLIDRIRLEGRVIDFLNLGIGSLRTGIFNVADMAISLGVILFFLSTLKSDSCSNKKISYNDHRVEPEGADAKVMETITSVRIGS